MRKKRVGDVKRSNLAKVLSVLLRDGPSHFNRVCRTIQAEFRLNDRSVVSRCLKAGISRGFITKDSLGPGRRTTYKADDSEVVRFLAAYMINKMKPSWTTPRFRLGGNKVKHQRISIPYETLSALEKVPWKREEQFAITSQGRRPPSIITRVAVMSGPMKRRLRKYLGIALPRRH